MSKHCPHCGAEQKNQAIFCGVCGKPLPLGPELRADAESEKREEVSSFSRVPDASTTMHHYPYASVPVPRSTENRKKIFALVAALLIVVLIVVLVIFIFTKPTLKIDTILYLCETDNVANFVNSYKVSKPPWSSEAFDDYDYFPSRFMERDCFVLIYSNADSTFASALAWSHEPVVEGLVGYYRDEALAYLTEQFGEYEFVNYTYVWPHPTSQLKDARIELTWYNNGSFKLETILKDD